MFNNVLVGVDVHDGRRDAITLAKLLCDKQGVLTLAYVYPLEPGAWRGTFPAYDAGRREEARQLLEDARQEAGIDAQLHMVGSPSVGRGLHESAEALGADLLVVGSARRGILGRVLVGDDSRVALNGAPCAVAIAPAGYAQRQAAMREIGVGYDGSPESEHALRVARKLAEKHHAKLSALEAIFFPSRLAVGPPFPDAAMVEGILEQAQQRIAGLGSVEPHVAYGEPAEELALYSASLDLLVVGSRSYGPIGRLVHGSTSQQLARSARSPLLVLTRAAREAEQSAAPIDEREPASATA